MPALFSGARRLIARLAGSDNSDLKRQGNALLAEGKLLDAMACYQQAASVRPDDAQAYLNLGYVQLEQSKYSQAVQSLERAASLDDALADAPYLLGRAHQEQGRLSEAAAHFVKAVALNPALVHAWRDLGQVRKAQGDLMGAVQALESALRAQPDFAVAKLDLATVLLELERGHDALRWADQATAAFPELAAAEICRSRSLHALGRLDEALQSCDRALTLAPADFAALHGRAAILVDLRRFGAALESLDQALGRGGEASGAERAALLQARSITLAGLWRYDEALASAHEAAQADPSNPDNWLALASAFQALGRHTHALAVYAQAVARHPEHAQLRWDESLCQLLVGDMKQGWRGHEWRLRAPMYSAVDKTTRSAAPRWDGERPIAGMRILLHAEQGLGDAIQFARYVPAVLDRGGRVILQVAPALVGLMRALVIADDAVGRFHVVGTDELVPDHDVRCSLLSLPAVFRTDVDSVPASVPYFSAAADLCAAWRRRLQAMGGADRPRVGLVWSGNPRHHNDHNRSLSLARLLEALPADMHFLGLQPDMKASDRRTLQVAGRLHDVGESLRDFTDTAALIASLDLVISVDTSVAHQAGALGRPLWLLLPHSPDWRWMLRRADTLWYPSCRLFRQDTPGHWEGALSSLHQAMLQWRAQRHSEAQIAD